MTIADEQRKFYLDLYRKFGDDPRALSARDAVTHGERFERTARLFAASPGPHDVHEVGCGLGHFGRWLGERDPAATYSGSDICGEFVRACRERFPDRPFLERDLSREDADDRYDWVVSIGVFNIRLQRSDAEWFDFVRALMRGMYGIARRGISVDFLTPWHDADRARPDLYYQPLAPLLDFVHAELSRHWEVDHSGPLYEYSLRVYRPEEVRARHRAAEFDRYFGSPA